MLDMGFLPDVRRILKQIPARRQTLFSARRCRRRSSPSRGRCCATPSASPSSASRAGRGHHPEPSIPSPARRSRRSCSSCSSETSSRTRSSSRGRSPGQQAGGVPRAAGSCGGAESTETLQPEPAHAWRSRASSRQAPDLVATDIVARGIDVEAPGTSSTSDVPCDPDSYVHRVGRTARAEATGDAVHVRLGGGAGGTCGDSRASSAKPLPRVSFRASITPASRMRPGIARRAPASRGTRTHARRSGGTG